MSETFDYAAGTLESRNPLRRFAHRARYRLAAELVHGSALDYGCGDGHFLRLVAGRTDERLGYDPWEYAAPKDVPFVRDLSAVDGRFDYITCLEVVEHMSTSMVRQFWEDVMRLLKPDGTLIVSVPVLIGPAGFFKAMLYRGKEAGYTTGVALRYLVGAPPARDTSEDRMFTHLHFDYRSVRSMLRDKFVHVRQVNCPFRLLPAGLNSQLFFICSGWR